jgi:hypothetical protein
VKSTVPMTAATRTDRRAAWGSVTVSKKAFKASPRLI